MAEIKASEGQSLADVAVWLLGATDALFALADANDLPITATLQAGQLLQIPEGFTANPQMVKFLAEKKVVVNTSNITPEPEPESDELNDWLESDFSPTDFL